MWYLWFVSRANVLSTMIYENLHCREIHGRSFGALPISRFKLYRQVKRCTCNGADRWGIVPTCVMCGGVLPKSSTTSSNIFPTARTIVGAHSSILSVALHHRHKCRHFLNKGDTGGTRASSYVSGGDVVENYFGGTPCNSAGRRIGFTLRQIINIQQ